MADTNWMDGWLNTQQSYWKAWSDLAQQSMKTSEMPRNPMVDGLNKWWQAVSPMTPPEGRDVFDKLMDVSRGYFSLVERFMSGAQEAKGPEAAINGWLEGMQKTWGEWLQGGLPHSFTEMGQQFKGLSTFWDLPMDTWQRLAANVMPMPGDFTHAFHPEGGVHEQVNRFLSIPAVGYTRESQEQFQILAQRQMDYAMATQAYQMAFGKLAMATAQKFQQSLRERTEEHKPITSLRELYDQWVEMSEAAYADFVMTEEYQELYGRLVNTLLALKQQMARMVDQTLEALHMPTHAEISTLQCRQQEIRRENLRLRKELKAMQGQIDDLRNAMLKAAVEKPAMARATAAAKPATRKVATPKAAPKAAPKTAAKKPVAKAAPARPASTRAKKTSTK